MADTIQIDRPVEAPAIRAGQRLLSIDEVLARTSIGKTDLYRMMKAGEFPKQRQVGHRSRWIEAEVDAWIIALPVK